MGVSRSGPTARVTPVRLVWAFDALWKKAGHRKKGEVPG